MIASLLFALGLYGSLMAVLYGFGQAVWLVTRRRRSLAVAAASAAGSALIVLAYRRQYRLNARIEAANDVGRWDSAFLPLCIAGLVLVVLSAVVALRRASRERGPSGPATTPRQGTTG